MTLGEDFARLQAILGVVRHFPGKCWHHLAASHLCEFAYVCPLLKDRGQQAVVRRAP